jgi:ABC-type bacteriocin/lantibiotic exporter with double-glycine peptidase domain
MLFYSIKMTLIAIACLPIMILFGIYFAKITTQRQQKVNKKWDNLY